MLQTPWQWLESVPASSSNDGGSGSVVADVFLVVSKKLKSVQNAAWDLQHLGVTNNGNQQRGPMAFNGTNIGTHYPISVWSASELHTSDIVRVFFTVWVSSELVKGSGDSFLKGPLILEVALKTTMSA